MLSTEPILRATGSEVITDSGMILPVVLETEILADLEIITPVGSEMETLADSEAEIQTEASEIRILEGSVEMFLSRNQDIMEVSDPVIPEDSETVADLIIPEADLDLVAHQVAAASDLAVLPVEVSDPAASDNIQFHKKLLRN